LLPGLVGYIGAAVQLGFTGGEVHGKSKAGGNSAFFAVGFWQEFENLNTG
jgi:hypothetical protein